MPRLLVPAKQNPDGVLHEADTLIFADTTFPQNQSGTQRYQFKDNRGTCWDRTITAAAGALTSVTDGCQK